MPEAADLAAFWTNILRGVDCIRELPEGRWRRDLYFDADPAVPDRSYAAVGGFLPKVPFDPLAFGLPPKALESLDSSQLLGLLAAKAALEDAGYPAGAFDHARTGVILGLAGTTMKSLHDLRAALEGPLWQAALREQGFEVERIAEVGTALRRLYPAWEENSFPGFLANVVAGRIANRFDLGGPSFAVDAACASSLCAVGLAMDALAAGRADLMLSGGLDTDNSATAFLSFSKTPALSPGGKVRAFDAGADGTVISEGVGLLVLKRLADAERDGDRIYAVLRGYGATSDGRSKSIYAPRPEGQVRAVREALGSAGIAGDSVGLVEAHATGTEVGDAVEFEALTGAYGGAGAPPRSIALGSVKSQIGHTKAAAGAASLIKTALALHHKALPPTLNVETPNPRLDLAETPFYLNTRTRPWTAPAGRPRRAGVSAFGFGGANFHVLLEEAPAAAEPLPLAATPLGLLVEAESPTALATRCRELAARLGGAEAGAAFAGLAAAQAVPPAAGRPRLGFVAADPAEAVGKLSQGAEALARAAAGTESWSLPGGLHYRPVALPEAAPGGLVALFPGQGSQYVGMGEELAVAFPQLRSAIERLDHRLDAAGLATLSAVLHPPPLAGDALGRRAAREAALRRTLYAQAGVGALSLGLLRALESGGFRPDFAVGHSFGELSALVAAGALDEEAYLDLVVARGRALTPPEDGADAGGLLVVELERAAVETLLEALPGISLANANGPRQTVIGGPTPAVEAAERRLAELSHTVLRLPVAAAFHTPSVGYAESPWRRALAEAALAAPRLPVASNAAGGFYEADAGSLRAGLAAQPFAPVLFQQNIEAIYAAGGRIFVEIGPRSVLGGLVGAILGERPHLAISLDPGRGGGERRLREAVVQLRVAGLALTEPRPFRRPVAPAPLPDHGAVVWIDGDSPGAAERRRSVAAELARLAERRPAEQPAARPPALPESPAVPAGPAAVSAALSAAGQGALGRAFDLEDATLAAHREFLGLQGEQARLLAELSRAGADPTLFERVRAQQEEVTRLHADFLAGQRERSQGLRDATMPAPSGGPRALPAVAAPTVPPRAEPPALPAPVAVPAAAPAAPAVAAAELLPRLLAIVAEATGYPAEFLGPDMDMEADLGIDSIKRVEILAGLRESLGEAGRRAGALPSSALAGAHSLRALSEALARHVAGAGAAAGGAPLAAGPCEPAPAAAAQAAGGPEALHALLTDIVADKTGYPPDMLAPELDIEADLGIDSIKRVEILSALRQALGGDAGRWPDRKALAGARTLGEVARLLAGVAASMASEAVSGGAEPANCNDQPAAAERPSAEAPDATTTGQLQWRALPPARPGHPLPAGVLLLCAEAGPLTVALAQALEAAGATVVVLLPPIEAGAAAAELPETLHCLPLGDDEPASLDAALARVERLFGPLAGALFCWPAGPEAAEAAVGPTAPLARALRLAGGLDARLGAAGSPAFVTLAPADAPPAAAGLRGLVRTLAQEWPSVRARALETAAGLDPARVAEAVLAELTDAGEEASVVSLDGGGRRGLQFGSLELPAEGALPVGPGDLVVVTGGGRGITADCAEALAMASGCRLLLLGRTAIGDAEPAWAEGVAEAGLRARAVEALSADGRPTPRAVEAALAPILAARAVTATLARLRAAGVEAGYRAADVADPESLRAALAEAGPVAGLVHGAGALADRRIGDKRPGDFATVFRPKIEGLAALLAVVDPARLKLLALFSSTAAAFGNAGQSDYAMANAVLDRVAERLAARLPETRVVALAWGPWKAGMVTAELARRFAERGIHAIEPGPGRALFLAALRTAGRSNLVLGDDLSAAGGQGRGTRRFGLAGTPLLAEHVIDGRPVVPAAWPLAWMLAEAEARGFPVATVEDFRVLGGLALDGGETQPLTLRLEEADGGLAARILAAGRTGAETPCYAARLVAGARPPCPLAFEPMQDGAEAGDPAAYLDGPIDYGPSFRGVARVLRLDEEAATISVILPAEPREGPRNPLAYDLATHVLLVWLQARHQAGCLPSRVGRIVWPAGPAAAGPLTAQARIRSLDEERLVADLALFDAAGAPLLWLTGFEAVVVGRDHPLSLRTAARRSA
ncbi:polyketide-type polyunsaturated fatty acid synthase PfaA [Tistlia consotensis]|nr:polyketide-type polyunsaturated fatty acid synthase PfaA [Tistlia consotensis]